MIRLSILSLIIWLGMSVKGYANQPVYFPYYFEGVLYERLLAEFEKELRPVIEEGTKPLIGIYETDLNEDGVEEILVKFGEQFETCNEYGCHAYVLGRVPKSNAFKRLGYFPYAGEIMVSDQKHHGIHDLKVRINEYNDFAHTRFVWSPEAQKYVKKG